MLPSELLERTWVNHAPSVKEHCLVTAIAASHNGQWAKEHQAIIETIIGTSAIVQWNDTHTKEEVIAVARLAEYRLGLRPMETVGEERASVVVAHALVN